MIKSVPIDDHATFMRDKPDMRDSTDRSGRRVCMIQGVPWLLGQPPDALDHVDLRESLHRRDAELAGLERDRDGLFLALDRLREDPGLEGRNLLRDLPHGRKDQAECQFSRRIEWRPGVLA